MVSSNEADLDLRQMITLPRNILHRLEKTVFTGQRMSLLEVGMTDYRDWAFDSTNHKG